MKSLIAIAIISIFAGQTWAASALITWVDVSDDELGFYVYRRDGKDGQWRAIAKTESDAERYIDDSLAFGIEYAYNVVAFNQWDLSAPSNDTTIVANDGVVIVEPERGEGPESPSNASASLDLNINVTINTK